MQFDVFNYFKRLLFIIGNRIDVVVHIKLNDKIEIIITFSLREALVMNYCDFCARFLMRDVKFVNFSHFFTT